MDNKKTKTAGYGLISTGLIVAAFNLAREMGWIHLTPQQQAALVEFVVQLLPSVLALLGGIGFLGLAHKGEKQADALKQVSEKVDEVKAIAETASGMQVAKDVVRSAVSDAIDGRG